MSLQAKFIEGTNKQYSIREDGIVFCHYMNMRSGVIIKDKQLSISSDMAYSIYIDGVKRTRSRQNLLFEYFGYRLCKQCNSKIEEQKLKVCSACRSSNNREWERRNYHERPEKRLRTKKHYINSAEAISKSYVARTLRINVSELPDTLYKSAKAKIELIRQLKQIQNA